MVEGNLKRILFLLVAPFASWMMIQRGCHELAHPPGSAPTPLTADHFARDYKGQSWLQVDGTWATGYAWVSGAPTGNRVDVFVPVVSPDWQPADAVHVVAVFGAPNAAAAHDWPADHAGGGRHFVTGCVAPEGVWDYKRMFPTLKITDPIVFIYEGQPPPSSSDAAFDVWFGIGIIAVAILIVLFMVLRHRRTVRSQWGAKSE